MHVAITGASSGIGEALAREYARAGARLTLVARRRELLERLSSELGGCHVAPHDLSEPARATDWLAAAEAAHGPIDILINNAGVENTGPTAAADPELGARVLNTNLHSPLRIARALLPAMLARRSGALVTIASVAALAPMPLQAWYAASKAGVAAFSEALRSEVRGTGVKVITVYPGPVKTAMADSAYEAFGGRKGIIGLLPEGNCEALARLTRRAVERNSARVIYPRFYAGTRYLFWAMRPFVDWLGPRPYGG